MSRTAGLARFFVGFVCLFLIVVSGAWANWENMGLYGGAGRQIAMDPNDPGHLFLADLQGAHYAYTTFDGGLNWERLPSHSATFPFHPYGDTALYDPNDPETVYIGTFRSEDNGATWSVVSPYPIIAVKPGDSMTLFARSPQVLSAPTLYRSSNGGNTWTNITPSEITSASWFTFGRPIAFDPTDSDVMYVSFFPFADESVGDQGIYKSTDGGTTWEHKFTGPITTIIVNEADPNLLLASGGSLAVADAQQGIVVRSADAGETWNEVLQGTGIIYFNVAAHPTTPDLVYTYGASIDKSEDFGLTWSRFQPGQATVQGGADLIVDPTTPDTLLSCHNSSGFFKMTLQDQLFNSEVRSNGIAETSVMAAIIGDDGSQVVVGHDGGASVSPDGGATWNHIKMSSVRSLSFDSDDPSTIYAATVLNNLFISADGGATWTPNEIQAESYSYTLLFNVLESPDHSDTLYVSAVDFLALATGDDSGLYVAQIGVDEHPQTPLIRGMVRNLVAESDASYAARVPEPATPSRLMFATNDASAGSGGTSGLYYSENSGESWSLRAFANKVTRAVALDSENGDIVYVSYNDPSDPDGSEHFARSDDAGLTWTKIVSGNSPVLSVAASPDVPGRLFAALLIDAYTGNIYQSDDYGANWTLINEGVERLQIVVAGPSSPAKNTGPEKTAKAGATANVFAAMDGGFYRYELVSSTDDADDTDGDGLLDTWETTDLDPETPGIQNPFDSNVADSIGDNFDPNPDGVPDGQNDWDGDGMSNADEFIWHYNPIDANSFGTLPTLGLCGLALLALALVALYARRAGIAAT